MPADTVGGWHAVLVGAGNIGSHLAPLVARLGHFTRITIIDPDVYDGTNLETQSIDRFAVGLPKAVAAADALRRLDPALTVHALVAPVEAVPLGQLRADLVFTSPDARLPRLTVSRAACRLGVPWWIDAGVEAGGSLARVTVRAPAPETSCYECAFSADDYTRLETTYSCASRARAATGAPAWLGALAAALQAAEVPALLADHVGAAVAGDDDDVARAGWQLVYDAAHRTQFTTRLRRNPACRFDHAVWPITPLDRSPFAMTVHDAWALANGTSTAQLRVPGDTFVRRLVCTTCAADTRVLRLMHRLQAAERACACGGQRIPAGFDSLDALTPPADDGGDLATVSLASIGIRHGDVFAVEDQYFEFGGPHA